MKRLTDIFLLFCLVLAAVSCKDSGEERSHVLKVYNWADYIDEDVLAEFPAWYKQQTGEDIRLIYQVFDINEIMLTKIERGHEDFDVVCPSEYIIERMLKKDLLLPIDRNFGKTPDYLPNISPYIRRELNKTSQPGRTTTDYAVPYMWGTAGILYNRNFITPRRSRQLALPLEPQEQRQNPDERQLPRCLRNRHHLRPCPTACRQHRHRGATDER